MKKLYENIKSGKIEIVENPDPLCKPDGILVKTLYSAISAGTEKWVVEFGKGSYLKKAREKPKEVARVIDKIKKEGLINTYKQVMNKLDEPFPLGYSCSGEVIEVGKNVTNFQVGDYVACFGGGYASHSEINYIPKNLAVKINNEKFLKEASLGAIAGIAVEGIKVADIGIGENIAVIGLGLLGQIAVQILKAGGCKVVGIEPDDFRREIAKESGCDLVLSPKDGIKSILDFTGGDGVDKVLITAATKSNEPIKQAGEIVRDKGIVSAVGLVNLDIPRDIYYKKELSVVVSRSYGAGRYDSTYEEKGIDYPIGYARWTENRNVKMFLNLLESGKLSIDKIITHIFDFADAKDAYDLITNKKRKENFISIILEYKDNIKNPNKEKYSVVVLSRRAVANVDNVRVGLIGAGNFVSATMLPHLSCIDKYKFVGIASSSGSRSTHLAKKYGFKYSTTDYRELIKDDNINLIIVATNHNTHAKFVSEALLEGKDVYCEKPLSITREGLNKVKDALDKSGKRLIVGFNRRFSPAAFRTKEILKNRQSPIVMNYIMNAGYIPPEHWVNDKNVGGGRIIGEACHIVDLFRYFVGTRVKDFIIKPIDEMTKDAPGSANANILIKYEDGSIGNITYTSLGDKAYPKEKCFVFSGQTVIEIDDYRNMKVCSYDKCHMIKFKGMQKGFKEEYEAIADAIVNEKDFPIPIEEILETSGVLLQEEKDSSGD